MTTKQVTKAVTVTAADTGNAVLTPYRDTLAKWRKAGFTALAGPAPTAAEFAKAHALGQRPGTKSAVALALYFRASGATQSQVTMVNGGPFLNCMRQAIAAKHAVAINLPYVDGHKVYALALPSKGSKAAGKPASTAKPASKAAGKGSTVKAAGKPAKPASTKPASTRKPSKAELQAAGTALIKAADAKAAGIAAKPASTDTTN